MDISAILEKIEELQLQYDSCQETIKKYRAYGASWALDCRQMRIAESNGSHLSRRIWELKAQIEQLAKVSADSQKSEYELQFEAFIARC